MLPSKVNIKMLNLKLNLRNKGLKMKKKLKRNLKLKRNKKRKIQKNLKKKKLQTNKMKIRHLNKNLQEKNCNQQINKISQVIIILHHKAKDNQKIIKKRTLAIQNSQNQDLIQLSQEEIQLIMMISLKYNNRINQNQAKKEVLMMKANKMTKMKAKIWKEMNHKANLMLISQICLKQENLNLLIRAKVKVKYQKALSKEELNKNDF